MKYIDAFLKKLKTDRNTFATYILMLISVYIVIDRLIELIFIGATGMSVSYWGPIKYTLALACPLFALEFSFSSKFVTEDKKKLSFVYIFTVGFYIIVVSMIVQWVNKICWVLFFSVPNYSYIIQNFYELVKPAFSAFAWYLPIVTFYPIFKKCYTWINDTKDIYDSVFDCPGIDLSNTKEGWGPYTCEMLICKDSETGKIIKTPETRRFESTLVVGVSGSGKTSMMFEPMMARDIEKKFFFRETSKEMGYTALRTGLATLNHPYSNEYINANFNLNMITPNPAKEKLYKAFMNKLILSSSGDEYLYKNIGMTYMAPDYETISRMTDVADNFGINYKLIDPNNPESVGLNPFVFKDPIKASLAISAILQQMYIAEFTSSNTSGSLMNSNNAQETTLANQAIENLVILLKLIFPKINEGTLPTLEDLLNMINNFSLIEKMTKILEKDTELAEQYSIQIEYYKNNFYKNAPNKQDIARQLKIPAAQIESLLRYPGIKNILCNRNDNINYDDALKNGEVIFVCTRRGDLGASAQRAFGLFFLLLMQQSVLSRPGNEKTRVPHFLYIDEFPPFICKATEDIFTLYRKYRVGTIISAQNLSQFGAKGDAERTSFRQTLLANCTTKVVFGNNTPEDNEWWRDEFGDKREWDFKYTYNTAPKGDEQNPSYDQAYRDISWKWKKNYEAGKIQALKFKQIIYKTKDLKGKNLVGKAKLDFLESRYKEKQKVKSYNFSKFVPGVSNNPEANDVKGKFNFRNIDFSDSSPNIDGPIAHNPFAGSSFNKKDSEDVNPIKLNSNINQAIDDFNNNSDDN